MNVYVCACVCVCTDCEFSTGSGAMVSQASDKISKILILD